MKILCTILSFIVTQTLIQNVETADCDGIEIKGIYHDKEVLITRLHRPRHLAVDYGTNTLFFSHDTRDNWVSAKIDLNTKEYTVLNSVPMGFVQTVDQDTHKVYIGGKDGLLVYNQDTNETNLLTMQGKFVWYVYLNDKLYFSIHPEAYVYTFDFNYRVKTEFEDLKGVKIYSLVIDNENDMIYFNDTGLYTQQLGTRDAFKYPDYDSSMRALATDRNGRAFICRSDGIYFMNKATTVLEKMFDMKDAFGLVFDDESNIIYSDGSKIVRLRRNVYAQC